MVKQILSTGNDYKFDMNRFLPEISNSLEINQDSLFNDFFKELKLLPLYGTFIVSSEESKRIDLISYRIFETKNLWWILLLYNSIGNPFDIKEGDVLRYFSLTDLENLIINLKTKDKVLPTKNIVHIDYTLQELEVTYLYYYDVINFIRKTNLGNFILFTIDGRYVSNIKEIEDTPSNDGKYYWNISGELIKKDSDFFKYDVFNITCKINGITYVDNLTLDVSPLEKDSMGETYLGLSEKQRYIIEKKKSLWKERFHNEKIESFEYNISKIELDSTDAIIFSEPIVCKYGGFFLNLYYDLDSSGNPKYRPVLYLKREYDIYKKLYVMNIYYTSEDFQENPKTISDSEISSMISNSSENIIAKKNYTVLTLNNEDYLLALKYDPTNGYSIYFNGTFIENFNILENG